jgi:2Fe-2S ferredoxin
MKMTLVSPSSNAIQYELNEEGLPHTGVFAAPVRGFLRPMPKVTYIESGTEKEHTVEVANGMSIMEGALKYAVPGLEGDCGGACACATCHVYVDEAWVEKAGPRDELEADMLDFAFDVNDRSRLGCQIKMSDELDGLIIKMPERQY